MHFALMLCFAGLLFALANREASAQGFKSEQLRYERVRKAFAEKEGSLKRLFAQKNLQYPPEQIFIRVFKRDKILELWTSRADRRTFELVKEYRVCADSGTLGPKRRQGDSQVPEGFYHVDRFNPVSNFHLSLGVNYPNQSDKILGTSGRLGGDIFIHGDCVTIGCVPVTDDGIRELYLLAIEARNAGQSRIPVHIFPAKLTSRRMKRLETEFQGQTSLIGFWRDLKPGFDFFEENRRLPVISIDKQGRYHVKASR
jgi:murein L,D-transpeptidase YafK